MHQFILLHSPFLRLDVTLYSHCTRLHKMRSQMSVLLQRYLSFYPCLIPPIASIDSSSLPLQVMTLA